MGAVITIDITPDGKWLALIGLTDDIEIREFPSGEGKRTLADPSPHTSGSFSPDGTLLATANYNDTILLWNTRDWTLERTLRGPSNECVQALAFAPDGRQIASGSRDGLIEIWEVATGKKLRQIKGYGVAVRVASYSPNGRVLMTTGEFTVKFWDANTGQEITRLEPNVGLIGTGTYLPDGKTFVVAGQQADESPAIAELWAVPNATLILSDYGT
jgi:WD40 repeat protein